MVSGPRTSEEISRRRLAEASVRLQARICFDGEADEEGVCTRSNISLGGPHAKGWLAMSRQTVVVYKYLL